MNSELWPAKVKNYLFRKADAGTIDLHYRDYEEPPGNGGFLLNGGRLYLDMGHIEYASPECLHLHDLVTYELAGDDLLQSALIALGAEDRVSFIKNNVDHHTGATFGCHENYLMRREAQFTPPILGTLLTFLATRQIFTGAGRVGQSNPLAFDFEPPQPEGQVNFQLSQRADHIVNDIYQWVQFNRAIINARDEPLADYRKYRRLHLLIGDSNMSPYANALKIGTTACVLSLLEEGRLPRNLVLADAVQSTRDISRDTSEQWIVRLENGKTMSALDVQWEFHHLAQKHLGHSSAETNWLLENWGYVLEAIPHNRQALIGGVDWITKKWLLESFCPSRRTELGRSMAAKHRPGISQHRSAPRIILQHHTRQTNLRLEQRCSPSQRDARASGQHARIRPRSRRYLFPELQFPLRNQLGFHRVRQPRLSRHG